MLKGDRYPCISGWFAKKAQSHPALMAAWMGGMSLPTPKAESAAAGSSTSASSDISFTGSLMKYVSDAFGVALNAAFPEAMKDEKVLVQQTRAIKGKPALGEYQCNNSMAIFRKVGKGGSINSPNDVAEAVKAAFPSCDAISEVSCGGGYVNVSLNKEWVQAQLVKFVKAGMKFPTKKKMRCVVDFSSPNIAKEMHVGHLRSTIIGEAISRILQWLGHEVLKRNHVGDWGTQFGMLITHLTDSFPDFLTKRPPIGDLQKFYKESKVRFDSDEDFKQRSHLAVVALQDGERDAAAGKPECVELQGWKILCDISRKEFDKLYTRLNIEDLEEKGESFYNLMLPKTVDDLLAAKVAKEEATAKGTCVIADGLLVTEPHLHPCAKQIKIPCDAGMNKKKANSTIASQYEGVAVDKTKVGEDKDMEGKSLEIPSFSAILEFKTRALAEAAMKKAAPSGATWNNTPPPLMVRKSDGGYGYDSTDMAAIRYRVDEEKADWIIYVTDAGQSLHFQLVFDAARKAGWVDEAKVRIDHIGFGVVLSADGTKFKTRSGETVRLVDLLDEAKNRSLAVIQENNKENKLTEEQVQTAAPIMGYGAVKYADLSNNLEGNYKFDFDNMLNFKGNTAVYLLYAYARVQSIFTKAEEKHGVKREELVSKGVPPACEQSEEWELLLHLIRFGETVDQVIDDLHPHHITDFAHQLAGKVQMFCGSKTCRVLGSEQHIMEGRLALLHVANETLKKCLDLVGIDTVERL